MEISNYNTNNDDLLNLKNSSQLTISLRKKKLDEKLCEFHPKLESNLSKHEKESENTIKLCILSKSLVEQKDTESIINILDKIYFFLISIKIPLKPNFIKISNIIPNLINKIPFYERNEIVLTKIYDVLEEIIKFFDPFENNDNCLCISKEQFFQLIYKLIDIYQNNENMMKKIFNFLSSLIEKFDNINEFLMTIPGCYFIQSILSLDKLYPKYIVKLLHAFCNYSNLNDETMKDFEIMFIQECEKIISLFYKGNCIEPNIVINNTDLFINLFSCLHFISTSTLIEVMEIFLKYDKDNDNNLFEKLLVFEKFDKENLAVKTLAILTNLFCSPEPKHIQILIENKSYQYAMDRLLDKFSSDKIVKEAAFTLSNFVNTIEFRKIFIKNNYISKIINKLKQNNSYEVTQGLLFVISNIIYAVEQVELISFIDSELIPMCIELLMKIKEPYLLEKILFITEIILNKGDPNSYLKDYYKNSDDKVLNPFKYQFDMYGFYDILSNLSLNTKNIKVKDITKRILEKFYDNSHITFDFINI